MAPLKFPTLLRSSPTTAPRSPLHRYSSALPIQDLGGILGEISGEGGAAAALAHPLYPSLPTPKIPKLQQNGDAPTSFFRVKKLSENAVLPSRASPLSAGYDLSSATETKVPARGKALVPTDLSIAVPEGTYARIAPRSGLAWKHYIDVGAGVIDADYRGPVGVILFNHSDSDFEVKKGDRIAQLIIEEIITPEVVEVDVITPEVVEVDDLDATVRGEGGFGSTGV